MWTKIWDGREELQYTVNITQSPWSEASFVGGVILMAPATWLTPNITKYLLQVSSSKCISEMFDTSQMTYLPEGPLFVLICVNLEDVRVDTQ